MTYAARGRKTGDLCKKNKKSTPFAKIYLEYAFRFML